MLTDGADPDRVPAALPAAPATAARNWRGDAAGGLNAALVALPIELVYGLFAVAPLGLDWAQHGLRAALWACVLAGFLGALLRTTGAIISGTASVTALLLGTLAASLMQNPRILASADPAATAFMLLLLCTALAGLLQWIFGMVRLGQLLKYVPYPVLAGLMCGVATLLLITSLRPAVGMVNSAAWSDVPGQWQAWSLLVFAAALALCFLLRQRYPRLPGPALAMLAGAALHQALLSLGVGADRLGGTSTAVDTLLPDFFLWQHFHAQALGDLASWLPTLAPYALAIAALASLESLLCLPLIEAVNHRRTNGDRQLRTMGLGNLLAGVLGATMTGANPARVAINLAGGASSAWSGVVYSATLLLAVVFLGSWFSLVPNTVTAAVLVFMASRMVDAGTRRLAVQVLARRDSMASAQYRLLLANFSVLVLVALVVVFGDMLYGVAVGLVAAMFLFVRAGMRPVVRQVVTADQRRSLKVRSLADMQVLASEGRRIVVIAAEGALFFGTADQLAREIDALATDTRWLILDLQRVSDVDPTGAHSLLLAAVRLQAQHRSLSLAGATPRVEQVLKAMGLESAIAPVRWYDDLDTALEDHEDRLLRHNGITTGLEPLALLQTGLADGMTEAQVGLLQAHLTQRDYAGGEPVFRSGDSGSSLYVATASVVDILLPLDSGKSRRVASFAPGVVFGEMALLDGKPRSADAVVKTAGAVWELTRDKLSEIERDHPEIAHCIHLHLSRSLAERLRLTTTELRIATSQ